MTYSLITLQEAKDQLSITEEETYDDDRIDKLRKDASAAIMDYIGTDSMSIADWTDSDGIPLMDSNGDPLTDSDGASVIPGPVRQACRLLVARLDDDREGEKDPISPGVASLLARFRDPPIA